MKEEEFNEKFRDLFSGMMQVAFEYVNRNTEEVDAVYVYIAMEGPSNFYNTFYKINNQFVEMHEVNSVSNIQYDAAVKRMMDVLKLGTGDVAEMRALFEEFQGQVPTQMKMIFEPKTGKFDNDISYDLFHSNNSEKTNADIFEEWFEEMK